MVVLWTIGITNGGTLEDMVTSSVAGEMQTFYHPEDGGLIARYTTNQNGITIRLDYYTFDDNIMLPNNIAAKRGFVITSDQTITQPIMVDFFVTTEEINDLLNDAGQTMNDIRIAKWTGDSHLENDDPTDNTNGNWDYITPTITACPGGYKFGVTMSSFSEIWISFDPLLAPSNLSLVQDGKELPSIG